MSNITNVQQPAIRWVLSPGELIAAGAGAGVASKTVTAPIDRIRVIFQVGRRKKFTVFGFFEYGAKIVRRAGVLDLWTGNLAIILRVMPYAGIQFAAFEQYRIVLIGHVMSHDEMLQPMMRFCAGAMAGATATTITYPLDLLRAQMAVSASSLSIKERHPSYVAAVEELVREEGVAALYKGLGPTLLGIVPNAGMSFMVFETLKPWIQTEILGLRSEKDLPMVWRLVAGGIAGFLAQTATYPLHVVRRRMQVQNLMEGETGRYPSVRSALLTILRTEGLVRGLYKGASVTLLKGPISTACAFGTNDLLKSLLARTHGEPERVPPFLWSDDPGIVRDPASRLRSKHLTPFEHLLSGGCAGAVAKTVIAPADRVKILYQTDSSRPFTWQAVFRTASIIYKRTGLIGLWRGHCATLMQQIPKSAVTFMTFDAYRRRIYEADVVDKVTARFIAGAFAGATATTLTYPLDLMRAQMAAHWDMNPRYPNYFIAFESVIQQEGARGLFKGIRPTLLGIMPYAGLSFMTYETLKANFVAPLEQKSSGVTATVARLTAGACAGLLAQTATYPLDIVRRRMQVHSGIYRNEWHAFQVICNSEGVVRGLFKGASMNWVKGPISVGVSFTINDLVKNSLGAR